MTSWCAECGEDGQLFRAETGAGHPLWVCWWCYAGVKREDDENKDEERTETCLH